jgi:hypothetical protein
MLEIRKKKGQQLKCTGITQVYGQFLLEDPIIEEFSTVYGLNSEMCAQ